MSERIASLQLTTDPARDILQRGWGDPRAVFVEEHYLNRLAEMRTTYQEIAFQAGNPTRLFAPAGGFDVFPLLMPSARELTIIDLIPFLLKKPVSMNDYSSTIHAILSKHQGEYITFDTLQADPQFSEQQQEDFLLALELITRLAATSQLEAGFQGKTAIIDPDVNDEDNFVRIIGSLLIMGVHLGSVRLCILGNEFRMQFLLDGREKLLIYHNERIDNGYTRRNSTAAQIMRHSFGDLEEGQSALLVKADAYGVAKHVVDIIEPNVIIGHPSGSLAEIRKHHSEYSFQPLQDPSFPNLRWGYGEVKDIQIGIRNNTGGPVE